VRSITTISAPVGPCHHIAKIIITHVKNEPGTVVLHIYFLRWTSF
jgi:hypothetical protein